MDYIASATITDNASLASIDLSSWKTLLVDFGISQWPLIEVHISGNDLTAERTPYVAGTGTTEAEPELVKSADLYSFKNIIDALAVYAMENELETIKGLANEFVFDITLDNVDDTTTTDVENDPLRGFSRDCFDYTWTETQDIISIVPILDCEFNPWP